MDHKNTDWKNRRKKAYTVTLFCMSVIVYCLFQGVDLQIYETAITMAFGIIGTVTSVYLGGQAYENGKMEKRNTH